jgi:hypothetical protein
MDDGEIWIAPSEADTLRIAYLYDNGVLLHTTMSRSDYLEWITYEELAE